MMCLHEGMRVHRLPEPDAVGVRRRVGDGDMTRAACGIAVVIPCYRVGPRVLDVIARIGPEVARIYCVDDKCPDGSGTLVQERCRDDRVEVLFNEHNLGVGAATIAGYRRAIADGARVIVKLDGDGQMDPRLIERLCAPILRGEADYTKGNR